MKKIQTNKGSATLPIIIGVVAVLVIVGLAVTSKKDDSYSKNQDNTEETQESNKEEGMMDDSFETAQDKEMIDENKNEMMDNESGDKEMDKAPVASNATRVGSYEEYSAEKIARANNGDVVLFFHASWCPTCRNQENNILKDLGNIPSNLTILKVDYDKEVELKKKYGITFQHTFVQVDAQGNVIATWAGGSSLNDIVKNVK